MQLVLPNTIDAQTPITAAEHQSNYEAIRDVLNGNIEGGNGADSNMKAGGVTSRELSDMTKLNLAWQSHQSGVYNAGDLKVTPGAGLVLNYASGVAAIADTGGVVSPTLSPTIPVRVSAGDSVTAAPNASGNPRIDSVFLTIFGWEAGTVSIASGTPSGGATLDNRTGAPALPPSSIRLADILVPSGFGGPFVQNTHIRDRRPWARGNSVFLRGDNAGTFSTTSASFVDITGAQARLEVSAGELLQITFHAQVWNSTGGSGGQFVPMLGGVELSIGRQGTRSGTGSEVTDLAGVWYYDPADGSNLLSMGAAVVSGGTLNVANTGNNRWSMNIVGFIRPNAQNSGA